ncbi:MAG: (2Fe-2S) ferredoxin domain-containing protein [Rubrobacteraceae bacterium]|nr:(2Fe-2S) ferredoxin domain-containing protein [Rubrobacteraceae bacterium]MBA3615994.1 (2Fe-2S) ferredoxin domain-containing protein [Rubrobacteraceae bacterium]MDQ3251272.1 (2Fe-2S) ferredoxin domain-containing protein [Actinomycetota bacterium]MDQ3437114.1 (2Fe-2S) ferredoxin domain-containing protein [Actinomycetota bacterium]
MRKVCQIFVCATPGEGRCGGKGGGELLAAFRDEVELRGIPSSTVLRNVCTRRHEEGPVVFVYPDDVWYTRVTSEDVPEIVERHLAPMRVET